MLKHSQQQVEHRGTCYRCPPFLDLEWTRPTSNQRFRHSGHREWARRPFPSVVAVLNDALFSLLAQSFPILVGISLWERYQWRLAGKRIRLDNGRLPSHGARQALLE
jgi:hypothetical protein